MSGIPLEFGEGIVTKTDSNLAADGSIADELFGLFKRFVTTGEA